MITSKRSVDLNEEEFDTILDLLAKAQEACSDDGKKIKYERLIHKVRATPAFDNPVVLGYADLSKIISDATKILVDMSMDKNLSGKKLEQQECVKIALAKSIFMWLNGENNLRRIVMFDFIDDSYQYEPDDWA